jgi:LacI family transcriptional regulator
VSILDQIAIEAGVSAMTVARVLKGDRAYARPSAAQRAERIMAIAERLDYRPNQAAKAIRTGRFGVIALIVPGAVEGRHLPVDLLDGILAETEARELHLAIAREPLPGGVPARLWRERSVDGVLVIGATKLVLGLSALPHVTLGIEQAEASVFPDDVAAGRQATTFLRHLGHRHIVYVVSRVGEVDRERGYREGLAGAQPHLITPDSDDDQVWARVLLTSLDRPTAVVCGSTVDALSLLRIAAELGVAIPQALSLIAIDSVVVDVHAGSGPTRMALPFRQVGCLGVTQLIARMTEPGVVLPSIGVPYELRDAGTCAPPP